MGWPLAVWRFLASPFGRALLLVAALVGALWWFRASTWDQATAARDAHWNAKIAEAERAQREAEKARDNLTAAIARTTEERAREASQETQRETATSAEKVRVVTRTIQAQCPVRIPTEAWGELNEMVSRANAARETRKQRRAR